MAEKKLPKKTSSLMEEIRQNNANVEEVLTGFTSQEQTEKEERLNSIRSVVNQASANADNINGSGSMYSFLNGLEMQKSDSRKTKEKQTNSISKKILNLNKLVEGPNADRLNELLLAELSRLRKYQDYAFIPKVIPQLRRALEAYVDNILSPDDFSQIALDHIYDDKNASSELVEKVAGNCAKILEKYNINKRTPKIIGKSLQFGDYFLAVVSVRKEIADLLAKLNPNDMTDVSAASTNILNENFGITSAEDFYDPKHSMYSNFAKNSKTEWLKKGFKALNESEKKEIATLKTKIDAIKVKEPEDADLLQILNESEKFASSPNMEETLTNEFMDLIEKNVLFSKDSDIIIAESLQFAKENGFQPANNNLESSFKGSKMTSTATGGLFAPEVPRKGESIDKIGRKSAIEENLIEENYQKMHLKGSIVKKLEPDRVVKLWDNGICYGYIYFEPINNQLGPVADMVDSVTSSNNFDRLFNALNSSYFSVDFNKKKKTFIYELFIRGIAKKINKESIAANPEFIDVIHSLLKQEYLVKKKVKITFFEPDEVVHFGDDSEEMTYHTSIFDPINFMAKLYVTLVSNAIIHTIVRSPSKKFIYVETGLEADGELAVQDFIRDYKSKDLHMSDIAGNSFDAILTNIGMFHDIFVPVKDGQKPIDIETSTDESPDVNSAFMEYLFKAIATGIGVPYSYLGDSENVAFAKTLTQESTVFLRNVVTKQFIFAPQLSQLLKLLYRNEYPEEVIGTEEHAKLKKEHETKKNAGSEPFTSVFLSNLKISLPTPTAIRINTMNEQIGNTNSLVNSIMENLVTPDEDPKILAMVKMKIIRYMTKLLPWETFEGFVDKAKLEFQQLEQRKELKAKIEEENMKKIQEAQDRKTQEENEANAEAPSDDGVDVGDEPGDTPSDSGIDTGDEPEVEEPPIEGPPDEGIDVGKEPKSVTPDDETVGDLDDGIKAPKEPKI